MHWTSLYRHPIFPILGPRIHGPSLQPAPPPRPVQTWSTMGSPTPKTCSNLFTMGSPTPQDLFKFVHYGKPHPQDLFKFVHYVTHISIGKRAVRLGLKGLIVIQVFFAPEVGNTKELECLVHTLKRKRINPSQLE